MSEFRQPWRPITIDGRRARLQILDPASAFDWEPLLIKALGDTLSFTIAAPKHLSTAVIGSAFAGVPSSMDIHAIATDPMFGPKVAEDVLRLMGSVLVKSLDTINFDVPTAKRAFADFVVGRLRVGDQLIETAEDWVESGLTPFAKWRAMAVQVKQTFGPLWTRAPYRLQTASNTYGVPEPKGVPLAVRWADNLARNGSAASSREILREWTPVEMIEVVENVAYQAEIDRRANDAARAGNR